MTEEVVDDGKLPLACARCNRVVRCKPTAGGKPRPPGGWTPVDDGHWCGECWADAYVTRVVTVGLMADDMDVLREHLRNGFGAARSLANWAYSALLAAEPPRDPEAEKISKKPSVYLYGVAKEHCPFWGSLAANVANAILRQVESDYAADRYDLIWTGAKSARNYRYPYPLPIPEAGWTLEKNDDDQFEVSFGLYAGSHGRVRAKLAVRHHQREILQRLIDSPIVRGSCKVIEARQFNVAGTNDRENSNGSRFRSTMRVMITYYAPRDAVKNLQFKTWAVSTGPESLLAAVNVEAGDGNVWRYNADHAKRIVCRHNDHLSWLGRMSDDRKAETRKPRREAKPRLARLQSQVMKDKNRLRSVCHEIATHLVAAGVRRSITVLRYDDKDKSFCQSFPWAMLRGMIAERCHKARIGFEHVNATAKKKGKKTEEPAETAAAGGESNG